MAITPITDLPDAPQRIDSPDDFIVKADAFVAAMTPWGNEANVLGAEVNALSTQAVDASLIAVSSANFAGDWSTLGAIALNVPSSVSHDDEYWQLLVDLGDISGSEPGVSANWLLIPTSLKPIHLVTTGDSTGITDSPVGFPLTVVDTLIITATRAGWWKYTAMLEFEIDAQVARGVFFDITNTGAGAVHQASYSCDAINFHKLGETPVNGDSGSFEGKTQGWIKSLDDNTRTGKIDAIGNNAENDGNMLTITGFVFSTSPVFTIGMGAGQFVADATFPLVFRAGSHISLEYMGAS